MMEMEVWIISLLEIRIQQVGDTKMQTGNTNFPTNCINHAKIQNCMMNDGLDAKKGMHMKIFYKK
jgi:hypothetical protein